MHGILQARILECTAFPFSRGIFPTQELNPGLPHCRRTLYQLRHKGSPRIQEWVAYPFSKGSSQPRNQLGSPALQADSLLTFELYFNVFLKFQNFNKHYCTMSVHIYLTVLSYVMKSVNHGGYFVLNLPTFLFFL